MSADLSRIEIGKLAHDLGTDTSELEFLADRSPAELADLRALVTRTILGRQARQAKLLASLSGRLPASITAKIAAHALGPRVSARVASAMPPEEAARLAEHFEPEFLTRLATSLDPDRVATLIAALPEDLVVEVGRRLMAAGEYVTVGRLVAVVPTAAAVRVVSEASPDALLEAALYTEDQKALAAVIDGLGDRQRAALEQAADAAGVRPHLPPTRS